MSNANAKGPSSGGESASSKPLYQRYEVVLAVVVVLSGLIWVFSGSRSLSPASPPTAADHGTVKSATLTRDDAFIDQEYQDILGRKATDAEMSAARAQWSSRGKPQLVAELFHRQEFADQAIFVGSCYLGILGREPDYDGWLFWINNLRHAPGASRNGLILTLVNTPEYHNARANPDIPTQYQQVYQALYGKAGAKAPSMGADRGDLLRGLLASKEAQDVTWKRLFGHYLFFTQLKRQPAPSEASAFRNLAGDPARELDAISEILKGSEYLKRTF
jgi:hypothetical protein